MAPNPGLQPHDLAEALDGLAAIHKRLLRLGVHVQHTNLGPVDQVAVLNERVDAAGRRVYTVYLRANAELEDQLWALFGVWMAVIVHPYADRACRLHLQPSPSPCGG